MIGWHNGDRVDNYGFPGKEYSDFDKGTSEENIINVERGSYLFVGSIAGAVLDIDRFGTNVLRARQIGLGDTPALRVRENRVYIDRGLIPDQTPGMLIVNRIRRVYKSSDNPEIEMEYRGIMSQAISGGPLTDTTILNRTGLVLVASGRLYLSEVAPEGVYVYTCSDGKNKNRYKNNIQIRRAPDFYPAGGLISEVYYPDRIIAPTVTVVSAQQPDEIIREFASEAGSLVVVYRETDGLMMTEVTEYRQYESKNTYTNPETGMSNAGSYYSFTGTRPDWIENRIAAAYNRDRSSENVQDSSASGSQSTRDAANAGAADSQSTAGNDGRARAAADGSTAKDAGSNGQSETGGNQAAGTAGNASDGSQGGRDDNVKGNGAADVDPDDGSDSTSALAMGGKMLPVAAVATAGALFLIFLLLKRRKEEEEQ